MLFLGRQPETDTLPGYELWVEVRLSLPFRLVVLMYTPLKYPSHIHTAIRGFTSTVVFTMSPLPVVVVRAAFHHPVSFKGGEERGLQESVTTGAEPCVSEG